jgi:hypothetical protein
LSSSFVRLVVCPVTLSSLPFDALLILGVAEQERFKKASPSLSTRQTTCFFNLGRIRLLLLPRHDASDSVADGDARFLLGARLVITAPKDLPFFDWAPDELILSIDQNQAIINLCRIETHHQS